MKLDPILDQLVSTLSTSDDLESFVRPLLSLLASITGLESTYLTTIDCPNNTQRILFARNTREMKIPEGVGVPWNDTLCKRAIEEGVTYVDDVDRRWAFSTAARQLGIVTYVSEPVRVAGELYGTLCGASGMKIDVPTDARRLLQMFATLIARHLERDRLLLELQRENHEFNKHALSDPLTGIPNRRALVTELSRALANAERSGCAVHVAFIDLDGFKKINDEHGHDIGDRFLIEIAKKLTEGTRDGDFIARFGGDEFVVFGPACAEDHPTSRETIRQRLERLTAGLFAVGPTPLDYAGASIGVITSQTDERTDALLARADAAMYEIKKARRARK